MRTPQLGSVSTGTLRTEDLLDAIIGEADYLFGADYLDTHAGSNDWIVKPLTAAKAITDYDSSQSFRNWSEDAGYAIDELIDALNEYAPPHVRFGAHDGDGADFGWWPVDFDGCELVSLDTKSVDVSCGLLVEVNDHGNITVQKLGGEIIWACV
jgi:hypothetical protein